MADPADIARANDPTAEELALARKIAGQHMGQEWDEIVLGWWDHLHEIQIALAAIHETTELCARLVENPDRKGREWAKDSLWGNISTDLSTALRTNAHLKDIGHDA